MGTSISDTYVDSSHGSTNYAGAQSLRILGSGGVTCYSYLLPKGFATGKDVLTTSATLQVYTSSAWPACTLTARTMSAGTPSITQRNYNNRPASVSAGAISQSLGALSSGTLIEIDVTTFVDAWAKGTAPNYGIRLDGGATADKRLYSANALPPHADLRPRLVVTQYRKPSTPQVLAPNGGRQVSIARPTLTWVPPSDPLMEQSAYKVQMNATNVWTSPTYDSGWVSSNDGEHAVTFDINDGETWFWRVSIRNGGAQESSWTAGQEFGRTVKPTFSITQPTGGTWSDPTPPVEWTALSAGTQVLYSVEHFIGGVLKVLSDWLPGPDTSWTFSQAIPGFDSGEVTTRVSLRDDVDRIATPGDDVWIVQEETWVYTPGATEPADSITADKHPTLPVPLVQWERAAGTPDWWSVQRSIDSGPWTVVAKVEGPDLHVSGTSYEFTDITAPPYHDIEYRAVASTNLIDSDDNPTAQVLVESNHIWLMDPDDDTFWVALADKDESGLRYTEDSDVFYVKGASVPQVVFDAFRGFEGTISGGVYGTDSSPHLGRTARQMRDTFVLQVKADPTRVLRLVQSDQNIPVIVRNASPILRPDPEVSFGIVFDAIQVGDELPWS